VAKKYRKYAKMWVRKEIQKIRQMTSVSDFHSIDLKNCYDPRNSVSNFTLNTIFLLLTKQSILQEQPVLDERYENTIQHDTTLSTTIG
jgi:hypothetical protein